ncbi:hypothetical protein HYPBUDRAFT_105679 [Hyphopichia burtonii NRRL Y-1933]|uniref:ER membrane protein complex subunit 6 n=1 Tax=Hyphopichia burtonii NRRL Y-1933 TaxID=984485 RepID=A0A1E4RPG1_9ASCO|nr:hypothetical protein HYPBUDRAFT_105679 [Hyphopichia burtonii NRRL Y-1933]ODV69162.1 hypothetical protein HYPBUDRAFT_105679 [Hyphopichia burtonii NRRL Y-1933]
MSESEVIYYLPSIESNKKKLQHIHDVMSLALGVGAGVLTLESLYGFLFYVVGLSISNAAFFVICCRSEPSRFFGSPLQDIFISSLVGNVAGYVMMWCMVYALVK